MVIRILSHWMGYFLPLLISYSIKDIESSVYLELSLSLIGGIPLDLFLGFGAWALISAQKVQF